MTKEKKKIYTKIQLNQTKEREREKNTTREKNLNHFFLFALACVFVNFSLLSCV